MMVPVSIIQPGNGFKLGNDIEGIVLRSNDCAVRVRFRRYANSQTSSETSYWSPATMITPATDVAIIDPDADSATPQTLTCPKCGRECTSGSGLTLHMKTCGIINKQDSVHGHPCGICGRRCSSTSGLTLHMLYAHDIKKDVEEALAEEETSIQG